MDTVKALGAFIVANKKLSAFVVGWLSIVVAHLLAKLGFSVTSAEATEISNQVLTLVGAFCVGQGIADHGGGNVLAKAQVAADSPSPGDASPAAIATPPPVKP